MSVRCENIKPLLPPKSFIPSAIIWGGGIAGVMAGVNWLRLGERQRALRIFALSVVMQMVIWLPNLFLMSRHNPLISVGGEPWDQSVSMLRPIVWMLEMVINAAIGYVFYRSQQRDYERWASRYAGSRVPSPYLSWPIVVTAIVGTVGVLFVIAFSI